MRSLRHVVHQVIALHSRRPVSTLRSWQELESDLDMTPLELVLVALEIEGIEDVDIEVAGLGDVRTVADVVSFFERAVARSHRGRLVEDVA